MRYLNRTSSHSLLLDCSLPLSKIKHRGTYKYTQEWDAALEQTILLFQPLPGKLRVNYKPKQLTMFRFVCCLKLEEFANCIYKILHACFVQYWVTHDIHEQWNTIGSKHLHIPCRNLQQHNRTLFTVCKILCKKKKKKSPWKSKILKNRNKSQIFNFLLNWRILDMMQPCWLLFSIFIIIM